MVDLFTFVYFEPTNALFLNNACYLSSMYSHTVNNMHLFNEISGREGVGSSMKLSKYLILYPSSIFFEIQLQILRAGQTSGTPSSSSASAPQTAATSASSGGRPAEPSAKCAGGSEKSRRRGNGIGTSQLPVATVDPHVPQLLVFPHGTELHTHWLVESGQLVLQVRCMQLSSSSLSFFQWQFHAVFSLQ